jgi:hypothetical protein
MTALTASVASQCLAQPAWADRPGGLRRRQRPSAHPLGYRPDCRCGAGACCSCWPACCR